MTESRREPRIRFSSSVFNIFQSIHYLDKPTILVPVGHISAAPLTPGSVKRLAILRVSPAAEAYEAVGVETHRLATVPLTGTVDFQICLCDAAIGVHLVAEAIVLAARNRVARSLALADYIDRPVGDADDAERSRLDMAMSLREAVSESVAAERELLRDCDISGKRGLLDLCDFTEALGLDVKYYNEEYPAVEQCAARDLADKIDVQTCRYVRERVGVWICDKCGHDEGKYGAHSYRHCPICGRVIEKTVGK